MIEPQRQRRIRVPKSMPAPPVEVEFPWANRRVELAGLAVGDLVALCMASPAWQWTVGRLCDEVDAAASPGKAVRIYSSRELESVELFRRLGGHTTTRAARDALAGDRGARSRLALGFDAPRADNPAPVQLLMAGIPSEATLSRHRQRVGGEELADAYERFFALIRAEHVKVMGADRLVLGLDGTTLRVHGVAPRVDPRNGTIINSDSVTVPDAGYLPPSRSLGDDKSGDGWKLVHVTAANGCPLDYRIVRIHEAETVAALDIFAGPLWTALRDTMPAGRVAVLSADAGLHSQPLRALLRRQGIVESIHLASHSHHPTSRGRVDRLDRDTFAIDGYPHWRANGHREIACRCGAAQISKRITRAASGTTTVRMEGSCPQCGPITITSGDWRAARNPKRFARTQATASGTGADTRDLSFGNPLTYHDGLSRAYGRARFGHLEGFHGVLEHRFKLIKHKRYYRSETQVRAEVAALFGALHVLALHQRVLAAADHTCAPSPGRDTRLSA
jgi:hypothetical protein